MKLIALSVQIQKDGHPSKFSDGHARNIKTYEVTVGAFPSIQIKIDGTILVLCVCPGQQHSKD